MLRRLKKAMLQNPIVLAAPLTTNLERRPITVKILSPAGFSLRTVQKVALGLLIVPTVLGTVFSLLAADWTMFFICGFLLLMVGLIVWVIRLRAGMT